jgi:hypothetical protein
VIGGDYKLNVESHQRSSVSANVLMSCSVSLNLVYARIIGRFEVPTGVSNKITVFCDVILCSLIYRNHRFEGTCCLNTVEVRGSWFFRKVDICLPKYTATHPQNIGTLKDVFE